jgi:mannose-6-phosphate isomerase-like protein (cupin superfamily)
MPAGARVTSGRSLFGSHGRYRIEQLQNGDVGYIPQGYGHSIENVGDSLARILIGFTSHDHPCTCRRAIPSSFRDPRRLI